MNWAGLSSEFACRWISAATAARYVESRAWGRGKGEGWGRQEDGVMRETECGPSSEA